MQVIAAFDWMEQRRVPINVRPGMSLAAVARTAIAAEAETRGRDVEEYEWFFEHGIITINGVWYERDAWAVKTTKPDDIVELYVTVNKGKIGKIALALGVIALAVATAFIAPYATGALMTAGLSATAAQAGGAIIAGLVGFAGQLALKALTPSPKMGGGGGAQQQLSQAGINSNQIVRDDPLPSIIGKVHASPPSLIPAYTTLEQGTIWVHAMVGLAGRNKVEDIRINGVPISGFPLAKYEVYEGGGFEADSFLSSKTVIQNIAPFDMSTFKVQTETGSGTRMIDTVNPENSAPQWHRVRKHADADEVRLLVQFEGGIVDDTGAAHAVPFRLRVRKMGDTAWRNLPQIHIKDIKISGPFRSEFKIKFKAPDSGLWIYRNDKLNTHCAIKRSVATGFSDWLADAYFTQSALPTDAVPTMTAATTSGVTVSGSSTFGAGFEPWRAFDGNTTTTYWRPTNTSLPATLQVDHGVGVTKSIRSYQIVHAGWGTTAPTAWSLRGSNDATNWTTLHTFTYNDSAGDKHCQVDVIGAFRYHQLVFTNNGGAASDELRVYEVSLSEQNSIGLAVTSAGVYTTQFTQGARYVHLDQDGASIFLDPTDFPAGEYEVEIKRGMAYKQADISFDASGIATDRWNYAAVATNFFFFDYTVTVKSTFTIASINLGQSNIQSTCRMETGTVSYPTRPIAADIEPRLTRIAVRIPDVSIDSLSATFTGYAREYAGGVWSTVPVPSRNPAAYYRDALLLSDKNAIPLPGEVIQEASLETFFDWCVSQGFTCDAIIQNRSIAEVLGLLASCGRASPRQADMWGVVIDKDRSADPIRGLFTPQNSRDLGTRISYPDIPDALRVSYFDETDDWKEKETIVYRDGYSAATAVLVESESYEGITTLAKAQARALYNLRQVEKRRFEYIREVPLEGLTYARGDKVRIADEVITRHQYWGLVKQVLTSSGNVTGFVLDGVAALGESVDQITAVSDISTISDVTSITVAFGASIRMTDGTIYTAAITETGNTSTITLATPVADTGQFSVWREVAIGPLGMEGKDLLIRSIEHAGDEVFRFTMIDVANEIFA